MSQKVTFAELIVFLSQECVNLLSLWKKKNKKTKNKTVADREFQCAINFFVAVTPIFGRILLNNTAKTAKFNIVWGHFLGRGGEFCWIWTPNVVFVFSNCAGFVKTLDQDFWSECHPTRKRLCFFVLCGREKMLDFLNVASLPSTLETEPPCVMHRIFFVCNQRNATEIAEQLCGRWFGPIWRNNTQIRRQMARQSTVLN